MTSRARAPEVLDAPRRDSHTMTPYRAPMPEIEIGNSSAMSPIGMKSR